VDRLDITTIFYSGTSSGKIHERNERVGAHEALTSLEPSQHRGGCRRRRDKRPGTYRVLDPMRNREEKAKFTAELEQVLRDLEPGCDKELAAEEWVVDSGEIFGEDALGVGHPGTNAAGGA
jgi:hypothetical protein